MPAAAASSMNAADDVVGVVRVADRVGAAHQHLEHHVRDQLAQLLQPQPRVLGQEPVGDVERRAAPHLEREQVGAQVRGRGATARDVVGAQPGGQQRLVRVAPGRVGEAHAPVLAQHLARCRPGPRLSRICLVPGRRRLPRHRRRRRLDRQHRHRRLRLAAHRRVAVDDGRPDVAQDARRAIAARRVLHQLGRLVDERGVGLARRERRVRQHVLEERRGWSSRPGCGTRAARAPPCAGRSSTRARWR